jgi:hypothetical protein
VTTEGPLARFAAPQASAEVTFHACLKVEAFGVSVILTGQIAAGRIALEPSARELR